MGKRSRMNNPRGIKDFSFRESKLREVIERVLKKEFEKYGYGRLETSLINLEEVLSSKYGGGEEILKEVYKLDKGDKEDSLALRYDLTVPLMKYVAMNYDGKLPIKRYEIGKVFRDGPVKRGRLREFTQCDVDVVGIRSVLCEAEMLTMAERVFEELGIEVRVEINNVKIMEGIIDYVGIEEDMYKKVLLSIDKWEKIGKEGVCKELIEKGMNEEKVSNLLIKLDEINKEGIELVRGNLNSKVDEGLGELDELFEYVSFAEYNPYLARGLEVYTGTVYELFIKDSKITSSVGSGGRYDGKIDGFMRKKVDLPAVGLSFGLDVIFEYLIEKKEEVKEERYYVIPIGNKGKVFDIVEGWRDRGILVDMEMDRKKVRKALNYADKSGYREVIMVGESEIEGGYVTVKNLESGESEEINIGDLE